MLFNIDLRNQNEEVSNISKDSRYSFEFYNGAPEEYEDIADYLTQEITLKGARIA